MRKVIGLIAWTIDIVLIGAAIKHFTPFLMFLIVMLFMLGLFLIAPRGFGNSSGDYDSGSGFDFGGGDSGSCDSGGDGGGCD